MPFLKSMFWAHMSLESHYVSSYKDTCHFELEYSLTTSFEEVIPNGHVLKHWGVMVDLKAAWWDV